MSIKHILVTGGSRGIGRGIVEDLVRNGYKVTFLYKSNREAAEELISSLAGFQDRIFSYQCDVTDFEKTKDIINNIIQEIGDIDGLINNSGIVRDKVFFMMTEENWKSVIDTNLTGNFNVTRALITHFLKKKQGSVVNISSVAGITGISGQTNYCASKSGIIGFTKSLAIEVAKYGINVNAIAPGYIDTEMIQRIPESKREELFSKIPMGNVGNVSDVANLVRFLLSEQSKYITGQVIAIDGGLTA